MEALVQCFLCMSFYRSVVELRSEPLGPRMNTDFSVKELLANGHLQAEQEVTLTGWVWQQFEHCAIYDDVSPIAAIPPDHDVGISLSNLTMRRHNLREGGPLHRMRVRVTGKFHWRPKSGAGHMSL
jgi:hypothetical protein